MEPDTTDIFKKTSVRKALICKNRDLKILRDDTVKFVRQGILMEVTSILEFILLHRVPQNLCSSAMSGYHTHKQSGNTIFVKACAVQNGVLFFDPKKHTESSPRRGPKQLWQYLREVKPPV